MRQAAFEQFYRQAPAQGSTPESLAASQSGATCADQARSANLARLRELWREPRTMHAVAELSGLPLASICSLKDSLRDEIAWVGYERKAWPGRAPTKRSLWQVRPTR